LFLRVILRGRTLRALRALQSEAFDPRASILARSCRLSVDELCRRPGARDLRQWTITCLRLLLNRRLYAQPGLIGVFIGVFLPNLVPPGERQLVRASFNSGSTPAQLDFSPHL